MSDLYESYNYEVSYRAVLNLDDSIKVFTDKDVIEVSNSISFDIEKNYKTSFNYFSVSILSDIMYGLLLESKKENLDLQDVEGRINVNLKNPLTILDVKGYNEKSKIDRISLTIYFYLELFDKKLDDFLKKVLDNCFIYNSIKDCVNIDVKFKQIL